MHQDLEPIPSLAGSIPGRIPPSIRDISLDVMFAAILSHRSVIFNFQKRKTNKAERVDPRGLTIGDSNDHRNGNRY